MLIDYYTIIQYFTKGYNISIEDLSFLSKEEIVELVYKFPYRMATIIKYNNVNQMFTGKYHFIFRGDCYECGKYFTYGDKKAELKSEICDIIEFICEKCFVEKTDKK